MEATFYEVDGPEVGALMAPRKASLEVERKTQKGL